MHNLTRDDASLRARTIHLDTAEVHVDLTGAASGDGSFGVSTVFRLTADAPDTFVDVVGDVLGVTVDGAPVEFAYDDGRLDVRDLPTGRPVDLAVSAACLYSHTGEGLHRHVDPEDGRTYLYTQFEPMDARRAWPCFDQPDMKARWTFHVTAPADWVVTSNGTLTGEDPTDDASGATTRHFAQTPPLSSYITAVVAGEWAVFDRGSWTSDRVDAPVPLRIMCRQALAPTIDCDDIEEVTRAGLDFYDAHYGIAFPWGSYDQVFVPEYNLGAMENPGCVTFNESMVPRDGTTFAQRQHRANVILHEMCHMWFGDLVTPRWWDDLWLKESFADHQGSYVAAAATRYVGEWASFAMDRKAWAYEQDQLPTTHPIAADIPDVEAAKNNFDGITYAKGAAVLKQLFAYVGDEAFFAGARRYFADHAFSSATLPDLLGALGQEAGTDLGPWADAWLRTTGPSILSIDEGAAVAPGARAESDGSGLSLPHGRREDGASGSLAVVQTGDVLRPHRLGVSTWRVGDDAWERTGLFDVRIDSARAEIAGSAGPDRPDVIVPNDGDLTYAIVRLDDRSRENALTYLSMCPDPLTRAVLWGSLWSEVRDGLLDPADFASAVLTHAPDEDQDAVASHLVGQALAAISAYLPGDERPFCHTAVQERALALVDREGNQDRLRMWAGLLIGAVQRAEHPETDALAFVRGVADGHGGLGPALEWQARGALAAHGLCDRARIDAWLAAAPSHEAEVGATRARAALPDKAGRSAALDAVLGGGLTNDALSATLAGLQTAHIDDGAYVAWFLENVRGFWEGHSIGLGIRFVRNGFPGAIDIDDPDAEIRVGACVAWLEGNGDAPAALVRLMTEQVDQLRRRVRVQRANRERA